MATKTRFLSEQIREAVNTSGMTRYGICKAAKIDEGQMSKFMSGQVGLSLPALDRLAAVLALRVVVDSTKKGAR